MPRHFVACKCTGPKTREGTWSDWPGGTPTEKKVKLHSQHQAQLRPTGRPLPGASHLQNPPILCRLGSAWWVLEEEAAFPTLLHNQSTPSSKPHIPLRSDPNSTSALTPIPRTSTPHRSTNISHPITKLGLPAIQHLIVWSKGSQT